MFGRIVNWFKEVWRDDWFVNLWREPEEQSLTSSDEELVAPGHHCLSGSEAYKDLLLKAWAEVSEGGEAKIEFDANGLGCLITGKAAQSYPGMLTIPMNNLPAPIRAIADPSRWGNLLSNAERQHMMCLVKRDDGQYGVEMRKG